MLKIYRTLMVMSTLRVRSIDVFRASTMLLMIFVNDLWTLSNIPHWLEHQKSTEDFLGLADIVFPCFLFIVGMSIPFAINNRIKKGESSIIIVKHIIVRTIALLVMGLFTVNSPSINPGGTGISREWYQILMVFAFFLIWNVYPKPESKIQYLYVGLQIIGVIILIWLAYVYKGEMHGTDELVGFRTRWWGILGLIGWTYVTGSLAYLIFRKKQFLLIGLWIFFIVFNIAAHADWLLLLFPRNSIFWIIGNGGFHAFTFAGIIGSLLLKIFFNAQNASKLNTRLLVLAILMLMGGFISNKFWNIAKLGETPPWIFYCSGIAFAFFIILHWLVDIKKKYHWFSSIKPAGTSTLTCYLIPYFYYSFMELYGITLPESWKDGGIGIIKSIVYSFIIIGITYLLGKFKIRLKI